MNKNLGKIELVDFFGSDQKVVDTARVSYNGGSSPQKTETELFIKNLMQMKHMTPFEHCSMTFKVSCPIFVMRQWIRHRLASTNELSLRYSEAKMEFYTPKEWRTKNGGIVDYDFDTRREKFLQEAVDIYYERINNGVAKELARIDLPLSLMTEFYWTANLREILLFLTLRTVKGAQLEIREFANEMKNIVEEKFPLTIKAFDNK